MANRAQRRAAARMKDEETKGVSSQRKFDNQADRVARTKNGEWRPGRVDKPVEEPASSQDDVNLTIARKRTPREWAKFFSWLFIVVSAVAFLIVMWIPRLPLAAIVAVTIVFVIGVVSLFFVRSDHDRNPYVDENGTAV